MNKPPGTINKDLILRERLALQRTAMANDTTLLSFIRTALYFSIAGITMNNLLQLRYGMLLEVTFCTLALVILFIGIVKYRRQKKSLKESEQHIGGYKLAWEEDDDNI